MQGPGEGEAGTAQPVLLTASGSPSASRRLFLLALSSLKHRVLLHLEFGVGS